MIENQPFTGLEVAVIGMAGRFPAADNIHEFWENIKNGIESFQFFSEEELDKAGVPPQFYNHPDFVKSNGGFLQGIEYFDADFFGYTPTEAELLDPQMRLFHECSWEALEDAGYDPEAYEGLIGLFAGAEDNVAWRKKVLLSSAETSSEHTRLLLSNKDFVSARVSYKLNLKGPVYAIVTGCSTAMTSIHLACRSLLSGECDMAMAGGVYVHHFLPQGHIYEEGSLYSRDGHLRAFDAQASGTVFSSGAGIVVLKTFDDARADNDHIYAVIKGSAVNSDGNQKVNFTAPSIKGQAEVITAAYQAAEVDPETIGYLETHGTGTPLGDPIEISALKQAFNIDLGWRCPIGSVKTNIGHMDTAAGVVGFIKTVLVLTHRLIPPTLHFEIPNPKLELQKSPFYVNTELKEWQSERSPRRAAVSSFGFGGTNAHVILEEAPEVSGAVGQWGSESNTPPEPAREFQLILLSAKTSTALDKMTQNLVEYFKNNLLNHENHGQNPNVILADAAYTLQVGRQPFQYRKACVCSNVEEAVRTLPTSPQAEAVEEPPVVFMFSGQGSQYVNMGLEIYRSESLFRKHMDHGFDILKSLTGKDFKAIFYPDPDSPDIDNIQEQMNDAHNSGPIKFIFEYSLGKLLIHWGIKPHAVMGHSFGEYTAACIAGVFSVREALELALLRGELMLRTPPGGMMSIPLEQEQLGLYLETHPDISLAAVNSSSLCFVSGPTGALEHLEKDLAEKGVECININFPRAAHSYMMKSITGEFEKKVRTIKLQEPTIPFLSTLTGDWLSPGQITDPGYWTRHLEQPVQFCQGMEKLFNEPDCIFIQVGPDKGLPLFVNRHLHLKPGTLAINIARNKKDKPGDMAYLLQQLGMLWLQGVKIDWNSFNASQPRRRVSLPTYPFEGKRYWLDINLNTVLSRFSPQNRLVKRGKVSDWLYTPSWKRLPLVQKVARDPGENSPALIFCHADELGVCLAGKQKKKGREVIIVKPGEKFHQQEQRVYQINPAEESDYQRLFKTLKIQKKIPGLIIHLWNVTGREVADLTSAVLEKTLDLGLYSLLHIVRGMEIANIHQEVELEVITDNMQQVVGEKFLYPTKAAILGAVRVIPQEYPNISCCSLDIILPEPGSPEHEQLIEQLLDFSSYISVKRANPVMALRDNRYWTQTYEPLPTESPWENPRPIPSRLRQNGVYLITGGLGGIGLVLGQHLVKTVNARLILTGRSQLPDKDQWQHWLTTHPEEDRVSQRIARVLELEKCGAEVLVFSADSADEKQMQEVLNRAIEHFGPVNGIIHSAGLVDEYGVIRNRTREMTENILAPKVKGTLILDRLTRGMPLDFFMICSSIASLTPGFGEVGYAAANMFIDAFAHYKNLTGKTFFTAVNWDTWQEVGAAVESVKRQKQAGKTSYIRLEDGIRPPEGCEVFTMVLENPNPQVVVSTKDLELLLRRYQQTITEAKAGPGEIEETTGTVPKRSLRPRPGLSTPYVAPINPIQQTLIEIWQDYFGIHQVGIQDDFFELGGDSLMATIMSARIHKRLDTRIPLTEIFQGPTIEQLSAYIQGQVKEEFASIPLVEKKEYYPLSPAQKRLFVLQQMEPGLISYNSPDFFILEGELDKEQLNRNLGEMIKRHESLRTSFEIIEGEPVQRVANHVDSEVEYYTAGEEEARLIVRDFVRLFDLRQTPLLRVGLIKLLHTPTSLRGHSPPPSPTPHQKESLVNKYVYMFDMHHIITDGISLDIFADEFLALYEGKKLPPLTIQYKDFAQWQIHLLESGEIKKQEDYWLKEFSGEIPILEIPTDYPRPGTQSFAGRKFQVRLNPGDVQGLNRLSRGQDVTLYMTTLAVIKVLFSRLSNQETIITGTITAGRQHEDLQHIIGMFVNTLALKSHPTGDKTFSQYLQELKQKSLAAFENQDYPFEELVSRLNLDRYMNRNPLFDVMFSFQNFEAPVLETSQSVPEAKPTAQLRKKPYPSEDLTSRFDITLFVRETPDTLLFNWEYCTKLFKQETIERYGNYVKKIVSTILANPAVRLGEIEIITGDEKQRLLYEFNQTGVQYPTGKTLHQLFSEQTQKKPDQIALVGNPGRKYRTHMTHMTYISYRQLHEKSDQLARILGEKGVKADAIVGLLLERSPAIIIGILAVLKAGAAYLPIDPNYPEERITYMLKDSSAKILVTAPGLSKKFGNLSIINCQLLMVNEKPLHHRNFNNPPQEPASHLYLQPGLATSLAYIIYTSGTTGKPKGVMIQHGNVVRLMFNDKFQFDFNNRDVWTLFHSYAFDFSVWEMYGALLYGGRLVLIPRMTARDPGEFLQVLKAQCVTILNQTPSAFYNLMAEELENKNHKDLRLRYVIFGGEALQPGKLAAWQKKYPDTLLVNMFGITETTVHVTYKEIGEQEIRDNQGYIGKPIPTMTAYVLDGNHGVRPVGLDGELYVGGEGVSRGYLNQPQLTRERFIKNPYKKGERLYRSGDLAVWLKNGEMVYKGRLDHQVQIRGFRVELGEIENQLCNHPQVKEAAVTARKNKNNDKYLCAYIVLKAGETLPGNQSVLREFLSGRLPDYMIPSYFVQVEKIPLTSSGKIDKKSLPDPEIDVRENYAAPRSDIERKLVEIWSELLGIESEKISIDDNFFHLGGNSLSAARVIAKIHKTFDSSLSLIEIFTTPSIRGLAVSIKESPKDAYFALRPVEMKEYYPLSPAQQRLYVLQQLDEQGVGYNIPYMWVMEGEIDAQKMKHTLFKISRRHGSLRTSFHMVNDEPVQRVHDRVTFEIEYHSVRHLTPKEMRNEGDSVPYTMRCASTIKGFIRPFALSQAPLLRVGVITQQDKQYMLMIDMHHIIADGISTRLLMDDFTAMYKEENLSPPKIQYKDFSVWQTGKKQKEKIKQQEAYWLKQFNDELPVLNLPTDYPRPPVQVFVGRELHFKINKKKSRALRSLAQDKEVTIFMLLLSVFTVFLSKISLQEDIVVGTPTAGRPHPDLESLIGCFIKTLALRNFPSGEMPFSYFLREVKQRTLQAFDHQDFPYEELVEYVDLTRDPSRNPMFDSMFSLQTIDTGKTTGKIPGIKIKPYSFERTVSKFDLSLYAIESSEIFAFSWEYCTKLFKKETIKRFTNYFKTILSHITRNPAIKIREIEIMARAEKKQLLWDFNDTKVEYPKDKTIQELFKLQVERNPDRIAILGPTLDPLRLILQLTYRQLNQKTNQLSTLIRHKSTAADIIVGIMVDRSIEMLIGILGILTAGYAYLPIDPQYPRERIDYMLTDSKAKVLLAAPGTRVKAESIKRIDISNLLSLSPSTSTSTSGPGPGPSTAALAYVIYTSGSTGKPKGVMIRHQAVNNFIKGMTDIIDFGIHDCLLSLTTISFDIFGLESLLPLTRGTKVVIGNEEEQVNVETAALAIRKEGVTVLQLTPSRLSMFLISNQSAGNLKALKYLLIGGEALPLELLEKARQITEAQIYNLYGPTETTIWSAIKNVGEGNSLNIGKPIANTQIYILNNYLKPVPLNTAGELYIGGDGVASGYLNNPELTAEKFKRAVISSPPKLYTNDCSQKLFPNHQCPMPNDRLYRTGDLARWLPDGNIDFLGRADHQVKLRGFRIELGEIENRMLKHKDIKEAVVVCKTDGTGDKHLYCYIVSDHELSVSQLREYLSNHLPEYMLPSYFVRLEEMPLTPNGKINRNALPEPGFTTGKSYTAPGNAIEEKMVRMWQEVLGRDEKIGIYDNFFHLGGHSLKATILISRIHKELNVHIPLSEFFKTPVIQRLGEYIRDAAGNKFVPIEPAEKKDHYVLSSGQKRLYLLEQLEPTSIAYHLPFVLELEGKVDTKKIEQAFTMLISRHESLRTSFKIISGEPVQAVDENVEFAIEYVDGTKALSPRTFTNFVRPFDISKAPLLRVGLIKLEEKKHVLLVDIHHIITDGTSQALLTEEFSLYYDNKELSPLEVQYKDYAEWQQSQAVKEALQLQEKYWLNEFQGEIPVLDIPLDFPRPALQSFEGSILDFEISKEEKKALNKIAHSHQATLFMVLLTIYNVFLLKLSSQEDIIVGSPVAGRRHADLEHIVGMFVNTTPLRNYPAARKTFTTFLTEVKKRTLEVFENQDYPFEDLVDKAAVKRDLSRNPIFSVTLAFQDIFALPGSRGIPGKQTENLRIKPYNHEQRISKFDLSLVAVEREDGLYLLFEYCTKLFREDTILRFIQYFKKIISAIIETPVKKIWEIEILTEEEKNRILYEFNNTHVSYPRHKSIDGLFAEQVKQTPDKIAIIAASAVTTPGSPIQTTYKELDEKSQRLAVWLRKKGLGPDTIAAIMIERSLEMVVGILGILKAGAAYLPIEPDYPGERTRLMLKDSGAKILVTAKKIKDRLFSSTLTSNLNLGSAASMAYVIYTSGSTGKPKGVVVEHRNVLRLVKNSNYIQFSPQDRLLATGTAVFDITTFEIWGPLCNGITLSLASKDDILNAGKLKQVLLKQNISILHLIPQLFNHLAAQDIELFAGLRYFLVGGDLVQPAYINKLRRRYSHLQILHMYGPTENTTFSTTLLIHKEYKEKIPLGKPIANSTVYIVDKNGNLQPIGTAGEIWVGGDGVSRGYMNNPGLTAEKFDQDLWDYQDYHDEEDPFGQIKNAFGDEKAHQLHQLTRIRSTSNKKLLREEWAKRVPPGRRRQKLYHTGDMARWLPDGNIEFSGRIDHQVKIRGFRIELGEIVARLAEYPEINEAVVLDKTDERGDKYLCAYIVSKNAIPVLALREYLSQNMPGYMIPPYFVFLEQIPLTANGKIDRKALPQAPVKPGGEYIAPRNEQEENLAEIWAEVLGIPKDTISIDADFFELGGHSLTAAKIMTRIQKEFDVDISLAKIFKAPTIREIAPLIRVLKWGGKKEIDGKQKRQEIKI